MCSRIDCNHFNRFKSIYSQFSCFFNGFIQMTTDYVLWILIVTDYEIKYWCVDSSFQHFSRNQRKFTLISDELNTLWNIEKSLHIHGGWAVTNHNFHTFQLFFNSFPKSTAFMISKYILWKVFIQIFTSKQWGMTVNRFFGLPCIFQFLEDFLIPIYDTWKIHHFT